MILRVRRGVRLSNSGVSRKTLRLLGWRTRCSPSKRSGARNAQPARCRPVRREKTVPLERVRRTCSRPLSRGLLSSACGPAPCLPVSPFVRQPCCAVSSPCKDLAANVRCPSARPVRRRPRRWSAILFHCLLLAAPSSSRLANAWSVACLCVPSRRAPLREAVRRSKLRRIAILSPCEGFPVSSSERLSSRACPAAEPCLPRVEKQTARCALFRSLLSARHRFLPRTRPFNER